MNDVTHGAWPMPISLGRFIVTDVSVEVAGANPGVFTTTLRSLDSEDPIKIEITSVHQGSEAGMIIEVMLRGGQ